MKLSQLPVGALVKDTKSVYLGSVPIFRVLEHGHTGDPAGSTTLDFRDIICLKAFDAKESSNTDTNRKNYGNNRYLYSNILQWLNSYASAGNWYTAQHSTDAPPNSSNVYQTGGTAINPYDTEAGFQSFMSAQFRRALKTVSKTTVKPSVDGGSSEVVSSKIFLLSTTEVGLADESSIAEGSVYSYYSSRGNNGRKKNLMNDAAKGDYTSATSPFYWCLRTPYSGNSYSARCVLTNGTLNFVNTYDGSCGVAPAFCVSSDLVVSDTTDTDGAYTIKWPPEFDRLYVGDENNKSRLYKPEIITMSDGAGDIRFGIDGNGKYGYYKDGESTVSPFVGENVLLKDGSVAADNLTIGTRASGSTVGANSFAQGNNNIASGSYSHSEGYNTSAIGNYSHAEGGNTTASGTRSHAEGSGTIADGYCSHAEGGNTTADGQGAHTEGYSASVGSSTVGIYASSHGAHAEGYVPISTSFIRATGQGSHAEGYANTSNKGVLASGKGAHAEGSNTTASGDYSHSEGINTIASSSNAHAEGSSTTASGNSSHAEGSSTTASGSQSHAEGFGTVASGEYSHTEGWYTTANDVNHAQGHYNKAMTAGNIAGTTGDAMAIGNGSSTTLSNCFRVTYSGNVYGLAAFHSSGADYAEFFEWEDGNEKNEDRVGYFVTLSGDKIKKAGAGDYILGIISGQPSVIGNGDEDWLGRWQRDDFGRFIWGEIEEEDPTTKEKQKVRTILPNPAYDSTQKYIERKDRKEWDCVGMLGALAVRDDGTCEVNGFCGVKDGIATKADTGYRVIERVSDNVIRVIFR